MIKNFLQSGKQRTFDKPVKASNTGPSLLGCLSIASPSWWHFQIQMIFWEIIAIKSLQELSLIWTTGLWNVHCSGLLPFLQYPSCVVKENRAPNLLRPSAMLFLAHFKRAMNQEGLENLETGPSCGLLLFSAFTDTDAITPLTRAAVASEALLVEKWSAWDLSSESLTSDRVTGIAATLDAQLL